MSIPRGHVHIADCVLLYLCFPHSIKSLPFSDAMTNANNFVHSHHLMSPCTPCPVSLTSKFVLRLAGLSFIHSMRPSLSRATVPPFVCSEQVLLELSEEQVADLMHLRRLYLTKRALLAVQRTALIHSMANLDGQLVHPSDNSAVAEEVAARLKDIAFEDQAVLYRIARAVWVGVSLSSCQIYTLYRRVKPLCVVFSRL